MYRPKISIEYNFVPFLLCIFYLKFCIEQIISGIQPTELTVDKAWSIEEVKQSILNLVHPNVAKALQETDFIFGKGTKQKLVVKIDVTKDAAELEELVGQGMLVIFPKSELRDLPSLTDSEIKNEEDADGESS